MAGALEVSHSRIFTTEWLSDRKLTRLKAHRGTTEVGCHDNREKVLVLDGLRDLFCEPCDPGKLLRNQGPQRYLKKPWALSIYEKNPEISVVAKVEFPIGKKLFHLVINPGTWRCPTVDLELVQTTRNVNGTRDSVRKFQPGKRDYLFRFSTFSGFFKWDEPTKRVPFTAEPEIPEILSKWKAPLVFILFALPLSYFNVSLLVWTIFDKDRGGPNGKLGE